MPLLRYQIAIWVFNSKEALYITKEFFVNKAAAERFAEALRKIWKGDFYTITDIGGSG